MEGKTAEMAEIGRDGTPGTLGRRPLFQEIQVRIRSYIFERGLKPGEMLPTATEMANYLGVSLASLREGLRAMEALGMLETRHGIGTFVCSYNLTPIFENLSFNLLFDKDGLFKLVQIREAMEVGLISEAIPRIPDEDIRRLDELCPQDGTTVWNTQADIEFHRCIYRCLGNELVSQILDIYWMTFGKLIDPTAFSPADKQVDRQDHRRIVSALQSRDLAAAIDALRIHFGHTKERLRQHEQYVQSR